MEKEGKKKFLPWFSMNCPPLINKPVERPTRRPPPDYFWLNLRKGQRKEQIKEKEIKETKIQTWLATFPVIELSTKATKPAYGIELNTRKEKKEKK